MSSSRVLVLDEICVSQAAAAEICSAYAEKYAPAAMARGMKPEGAWRSPVPDVPGGIVTLRFMWSVPDVAGWWRMRLGAQRAQGDPDAAIEGDQEKLQWWSYVDSIAIERKRVFMTDIDLSLVRSSSK